MKISEKIKRIAFRLEANEKIGIGHLMRCLTIIRELKKAGIDSTIYSTSAIDRTLIKQDADYVKMDTVAFSQEDACILKEYMYMQNESILFIDSYDVTPQYVQSFEKYGRIIMTDSFCDYDVEMVIQPNAFFSQVQEKEEKADVYLRGLTYQPIRDEFFENQVKLRCDVNHILILSGGTFPQQFCVGLLEAIYKWNKIRNVTIVLGNCVSDAVCEELHGKFDEYKLKICRNVSNMSKIMCENDVVISACGSTIYEIMACGIPAIVYAMAENQHSVLEKLQGDAGILYAGDINDNEECEIFKKIFIYLEKLMDINVRKKQVCDMKKLVPCNGGKNIVKEIINFFG